jgi:predicted esterase
MRCFISVFLGWMWASLAFAGNVNYQGIFPNATPDGLTVISLTINGQARDALVYRPNDAPNLPLLIFFTGTGGSLTFNVADEMGREMLRDFANRENIVLIFPMQRVMNYGDWDNHSAGTPYWETATAEGTNAPVSNDPNQNPDLLFTQALIQEASRAYIIDNNRVYVNGFSNGAFFAYFVAATLNQQIAAFAETGGGLVLSNTTGGDPTPCISNVIPTIAGEARSCSQTGWTPQTCRYESAQPRPIAPSAVNRVPPAFLQANDDDDTVPFAHTCQLAAALPQTSDYQTKIIHNGGKHIVTTDYLQNSWDFLKNRRLSNSNVTNCEQGLCFNGARTYRVGEILNLSLNIQWDRFLSINPNAHIWAAVQIGETLFFFSGENQAAQTQLPRLRNPSTNISNVSLLNNFPLGNEIIGQYRFYAALADDNLNFFSPIISTDLEIRVVDK